MVNGVLCDSHGHKNFAVGPLPDYAIIQIEEAVIFWWRNEVALDYVPGYLAELEHDDGSMPEKPQGAQPPGGVDEELGIEVTKTSWNTPEQDASQNEQGLDESEIWSVFHDDFEEKCIKWQSIFSERMRMHRHERASDERWKRDIEWENRSSTSPRPIHQFKGHEELSGDDVVLSIASLWQAMRSEHDDSAFSSYDLFQVCHLCPSDAEAFAFPISAAVGGRESKHLIIPIIADKDNTAPGSSERRKSAGQNTREPPPPTGPRIQAKDANAWIGGDSHILLAIATRPTDPDDSSIRYEIFDSCPGYLNPATINHAVENTVSRSGWLARNAEGFACAPLKKPTMTQTPRHVPAQVSIDSCGIHAILNAWVHLLKLYPLNSTKRCGSDEELMASDPREIEFIENAAEMINLALAGHMDTLTIRAFMNGWGYCKLQDPENAEPMAEIATVLMTSKILEEAVERHREDYVQVQTQRRPGTH
ncbi:MAG: hypothetical protein Q9183_005086 [Haloplaca sp. 2 TL-2023]